MAKIWIFFLVLFFSLLDSISGYYMDWRAQCILDSTSLSHLVIVETFTFNKIEFMRLNSTVNRYVGSTEYGIQLAEQWNKNPINMQEFLSEANAVCTHYGLLLYSHITEKPVKPQVRVRSVKRSDGSHPAMLMCSAYNFYPKHIKVTWLRDSMEIKGGLISTEEITDGNWYYQIHSHLEYMPEPGEEISCMVEHASFNKPMIYKWDPSASGPARIKIAIGASGLMLGIVLSAAGFIYYKKKSSTNLGLEQEGEAQSDAL